MQQVLRLQPGAVLLSVIFLMLSIQMWHDLTGLLLTVLGTASASFALLRPVLNGWLRLIQRNRWLLLVLTIVLAYGLPGEGLAGIEFLPAWQGLEEALMQACRLLLILYLLACLRHVCPGDRLLAGIWQISRPFARHLPIDRGIVRLGLVIDTLMASAPTRRKASSLKALLAELSELLSTTHANPVAQSERPDRASTALTHITIHVSPWATQDYALVVLCSLPCLAGALL